MNIEAMKLALEALELEDMACRYEKDPTPQHIAKAITAIREVLAQPERNPLSDEEIEAISDTIERSDFFDCVVPFARAIEAAHGIKREA